MQKWLLLVFLIFFSVASTSAGSETGRQEQTLRMIKFSAGATVQAEVADTEAKRQLGLMFRKNLSQDRAMLFIFDQPDSYNFWMKNCLFAIDMIWLDQKKRIINVTSNVPPCLNDPCPTYHPASKALYVIETAAGFANEHGLRPGMEVKF